MTQAQYQLWLSTWNAGIKSGLPAAQALEQANRAAEALKG